MQPQSTTPDLGVPPGAVFFWGEVSRGKEPQANRRRALLADGTLLHSRNTAEVDWDAVDRSPFNTPLSPSPAVRVTAEAQAAFLAGLEKLGLFSLPPRVEPPSGWKVHGGVSTFVFAKVGERSTLVEFRPGAEGLDRLKAALDALLEQHLGR
jgi:hypothetical protein